MASQSLIDMLNIWNDAVLYFEKGDWKNSISKFKEITEKSSRHLFNISSCYIQLGQMPLAIKALNSSLLKDSYLVIALVQRAQCNFNLKRYKEMLLDLQKAHALIGDKLFVCYRLMGLNRKISICEVMFNMAAAHAFVDEWDEARHWLMKTTDGKSQIGFCYIEDAFEGMEPEKCTKHLAHFANRYLSTLDSRQRQKPFRPLWMPIAVFYPNKSMLDNIDKKDYLGQSKVIVEVKQSDTKDDSAYGSQLTLKSRKTDQNSKLTNSASAKDVGCKDASCLPSSRNCCYQYPPRRTKSRDSVVPDDVGPDDANSKRVVVLSSKTLAELHRQMPKEPPPRLVQRKVVPSAASHDVENYDLPPPPHYHHRRGEDHHHHRSQEVQASGIFDSGGRHSNDAQSFDASVDKVVKKYSPLRIDNDPWQPVDQAQISELETALRKQSSKMAKN